jgi:hypothetical protein
MGGRSEGQRSRSAPPRLVAVPPNQSLQQPGRPSRGGTTTVHSAAYSGTLFAPTISLRRGRPPSPVVRNCAPAVRTLSAPKGKWLIWKVSSIPV